MRNLNLIQQPLGHLVTQLFELPRDSRFSKVVFLVIQNQIFGTQNFLSHWVYAFSILIQ